MLVSSCGEQDGARQAMLDGIDEEAGRDIRAKEMDADAAPA